jgi:hypothetical protein
MTKDEGELSLEKVSHSSQSTANMKVKLRLNHKSHLLREDEVSLGTCLLN